MRTKRSVRILLPEVVFCSKRKFTQLVVKYDLCEARVDQQTLRTNKDETGAVSSVEKQVVS